MAVSERVRQLFLAELAARNIPAQAQEVGRPNAFGGFVHPAWKRPAILFLQPHLRLRNV
jgi:hypothetical protein